MSPPLWRMVRVACVLLLFAAPLCAAPPVDVPKEVVGEPGAFVTVRAKTDGATVVFVAIDPGLNVFPAGLLADKKATVVTASKPGRYKLLAYSSVGTDPTEPAYVTVVIGTGPDPAPDPKPVPPAPTPPGPVDPLVSALQAAYTPEADLDRLKLLSETMGAVVAAAKASRVVTTTKQLQDKVHTVTDLVIGAGKLPATRKAIGAYLATKLGTASQPMTDALWATAATEYAVVASALKALKEVK